MQQVKACCMKINNVWGYTFKRMGDKMKKALLLCCVATTFIGVGNLVATICLKHLIDNPSIRTVIILAIVWIGTAFVGILKHNYISKYYLLSTYHHQMWLLQKISHLPFSVLETKEYRDDFNRIKDNKKIEESFLQFVEKIILGTIGVIGLYLLIFGKVSYQYLIILTSSFVIVLPICIGLNRRLSALMYDYWQRYMNNTRKYQYISEVLSSKDYIEEKKVFDFLPFFLEQFHLEFDCATKSNQALGRKRITLELCSDIVVFLYTMFLFLLFYYGYWSNQFTIGLLISLFAYSVTMIAQLFDGIKCIEHVIQYQKFCNDYQRFLQMEEKNAIGEPFNKINRNKVDIQEQKEVLSASNVSFSYPNKEKEILHQISFSFKQGKKYAIVGANGAGKTTFAKILAGLYRASTGEVDYVEQPVVLFQDFNRYPMTIKDNIMLGSEGDREKLRIIEQISGIEKIIKKMDKGYDTELTNVKEKGVEVSGGEWQRIALARTLWKDGEVYILDEPTASLDPLEEIRIFQAYNKALEDKTVIYITHRLGFVKNVDHIIVLEDGRIAEVGNHNQLCNIKDGIYKKMFEEQRGWYENET